MTPTDRHTVPLAVPPAVPIASVQGTLALDLGPRFAPPPFPHLASVAEDDGDGRLRRELERWIHRYVQAAVEIVGGDRPASQLLRWTARTVYADLHRRAVLVARAGGHRPGERRVQPVRPQVMSVHAHLLDPTTVEASARVRYGPRSRAVALRFQKRKDLWVCCALEFA